MIIKNTSMDSLWLRMVFGCCILVFMSAQAKEVTLNQSKVMMQVNDNTFTVKLADTQAAKEFLAMLPLTIHMADYNHNEKHARLPNALTTNLVRAGVIQSGDLMLFGSNTLVLFYLTFDSSYSYTRIGWVQDSTKLNNILGKRDAKITFFYE